MKFHEANFPQALLLELLKMLDDWQDRLNFSRSNKIVWQTCLGIKTRNELNMFSHVPIPLLKIKMSTTFLVPDDNNIRSVETVVKYISISHNLDTLLVNNNVLSKKYISALLSQIYKRKKSIKIILKSSSLVQ